ncbi:DUF2235 domain-containing protein [Kitasatospora sp. NPDC004669]|uniref:DUF2235 domain-containing protein n=1 Tax=Kitasatospora sp. NPDC004669 TaxID=3154555 RepID=UPI0033BB3117
MNGGCDLGRKIIICSDGTGNTFDYHATNVTRTIQYLALDDHESQVAVYGQGLGATSGRRCDIDEYRKTLPDQEALRILPVPHDSNFPPRAVIDRGRGLLFGYGLKEAVREMYRELWSLYEGPDDRVFLFGFSRGSFAVRALAGLLYRCGLPRLSCTDFDARFECAWRLYTPIGEDEDKAATKEFRGMQRPCSIHFLGIWDTVKSYGGLDPMPVTLRSATALRPKHRHRSAARDRR